MCPECKRRDEVYQKRYDALVDRIIMMERELIDCMRKEDPDWLPFVRRETDDEGRSEVPPAAEGNR